MATTISHVGAPLRGGPLGVGATLGPRFAPGATGGTGSSMNSSSSGSRGGDMGIPRPSRRAEVEGSLKLLAERAVFSASARQSPL